MSEELIQSENTVEVAEPQQEQVQVQSENTSEVAEPKPVQDAETNAHYAEQRRKQELDQYRSQAETYQQQLDRAARLAGYQSHDELITALDQLEKEQERQQYIERGVDPDAIDEILSKKLEEHPDVQWAKEQKAKLEEEQRLANEWTELTQEFPNLEIKDIPDEVWIMNKQGKPLLDAYLRYDYKNLGQRKEQEAIQKLQQNQATSTGSLGGGDVQHNTSIKSMPKSDFESLISKVKSGEVRSL